jgi:shikimate kinase / 3-dehydroquinate synthase
MNAARAGTSPSEKSKASSGTHAPIVVVCGFMATGKSSVGRALARLLDVPLYDTDAMIEERTSSTIAEIFARDGEDSFRGMEAEVCASIVPEGGAVIATGGGAILREDTFRLLKSLGTMVLLEASVDAILDRIADVGLRPRLPRGANGAPDPARVAALLNERLPVYRRIVWRIDTTGRTAEETAFEIFERLRRGDTLIHLRADVRPIPGHAPRPGETRLSRVVVGRGILKDLGAWLHDVGLRGPAFVFSSRRVAGHHGQSVRTALDALNIPNRFIELNDDESAKTLDQTERLLYELADAGATRDATVIALGGGVTGDVAGFVAATYMRGLSFAQVPTTLLAQVDSSIGGKVGVNHPRAKNLIGTIHQPQLIVSDIDTLSTLPPRQLASGMGEVVKTAIIGSPSLFDDLVAAAGRGRIRDDADLLERAVAECARIKVRIVEEDPYERGPRRLLNLGHTLGHALESVAGFGTLLHGEAVAMGLLAAIRVSKSHGLATPDFYSATHCILAACGLPTEFPSLDADALRRAMLLDKKRRARGLVFVLPVAPGDVRVVDDVTEDEVIAAMGA